MRILLDTNVLLDVLRRREPFYAESSQVASLAGTGNLTALISAITFTNAHYILRKQVGSAAALDGIRWLHQIGEVAPCDGGIIGRAIHGGLSDFEDAVQYYSAVAAGAERIITRNVGHYPEGGVPVQTPAEFLAWWFARKERKGPKR